MFLDTKKKKEYMKCMDTDDFVLSSKKKKKKIPINRTKIYRSIIELIFLFLAEIFFHFIFQIRLLEAKKTDNIPHRYSSS